MIKRMSGAFCALALVAGAFVALVAVPAGASTVSTEAELRTAFANEDNIVLANDITITTCPSSTLERNSSSTLVLDGAGFTITQTCANERIMHQAGSGELDLRNVTIDGGGVGSGISDTGDGLVSLTNSVLTGGGAGLGCGVDADTVTFTDSTISDNHCETVGVVNSVTATLIGTTVTGNSSTDRSGAIGAATATLINSTVTGNVANGDAEGQFGGTGGGVYAYTVTLVYSTVVGNTAARAANVAAYTSLTSFGSVVSGPIDSTNCGGPGTFTSNGYNFSDDASCNFTGTGDRQDAGSPGLGALGANGGPTLTMLPQAGSPLLDAIPVDSCQADGAAGITTDQRGVTRPQGTGCDIGAVEVEASSVPVTPVTPVTPIEAAPRFTG
jgi:hypothetical protein